MSKELSELSIDEINNKLIENYKTQVEILKSMVADRDKLISLYEKQLLIQDKHIDEINKIKKDIINTNENFVSNMNTYSPNKLLESYLYSLSKYDYIYE